MDRHHVTFEISEKNGQTEVRCTHHGLVLKTSAPANRGGGNVKWRWICGS